MQIPSRIDEILLRHVTEYEASYAKINEVFKEYEAGKISLFKLQYQFIDNMVKCVTAFDIGGVDKAALGDLRSYFESLFQKGEFDLKVSEATVTQIFAYIMGVIAKYERPSVDYSEDYTFRYKGENFVIRGGYVDAITGEQRFGPHTFAQVIEALQAWDLYEEARKEDERGNFLFTSVLYLIACFALKEGEEFPDNQNEIERHISDRVVFFSDIPMAVGLRIMDFFLRTRNTSAVSPR